MDTSTRNHLETRAIEELKEILESGDRHYLLNLSRVDLGKALELELYFLGLYSAEDAEARSLFTPSLKRILRTGARRSPRRRPLARALGEKSPRSRSRPHDD